MMRRPLSEQPWPAALRRLNALTALDDEAIHAIGQAIERPRSFRAKREMHAEGAEFTDALLILDGWAARQRILEDGRRQLVDILLPGDLIGACDHARPLATASVLALTDVTVCVAPAAESSPALARAYATSRAWGEAGLIASVARIGRMNAQERICDLLLELLERLELTGAAADGRCSLPLTQEVIADTLGLTSVHVNRTLQTLRREGAIDLKGRDLVVRDPKALGRSVGRTATRVTAA